MVSDCFFVLHCLSECFLLVFQQLCVLFGLDGNRVVSFFFFLKKKILLKISMCAPDYDKKKHFI